MSKSEGGEDEARRRPAARRTTGDGEAAPEPGAELAPVNDPKPEQAPKRVRARRFAAELASAGAAAPALYAARPAPTKTRAAASRAARPAPPGDFAQPGDTTHASAVIQPSAPVTEARSSETQPARLAALGGEFAPCLHDQPGYRSAEASSAAARAAARIATAAEPVGLNSDAAAPESQTSGLLSSLTRRASAALSIRVEPVDEFGLDTAYETRLRPFFEAMCRNYLHIQVHGAQHIPTHGRALLVSNHSRALPWDGVMLRTALRLHHETRRQPRWLVEDDQFHAPFLGTFVSRLGAVRACQENAERLLSREELVAVFPEGKADKRYSDRHKLQRFGRGGYVKLALRTGAPVIPVAIVSCDEPSPVLTKVSALSKWVGLPLLALAPALPKLGALGVPPVPGRWYIVIGEPISEIARQDAEATRDDGLIHELNECVRGAVQHLVDQALVRHG